MLVYDDIDLYCLLLVYDDIDLYYLLLVYDDIDLYYLLLIYDQLQGDIDLTGTEVMSSKPIVLLAGAKWTSVVDEYMGDHLLEQMPPIHTWGVHFYTVPIATRIKGDVIRILGKFTM